MKRITSSLLLVGALALCALTAPVTELHAVVKDKKVTGLPPNTVITIKLPDGTTQEEESDDDGALLFPFPKGKSTLTWPGGTKVVSGGWSAAKTGGTIGGSIAGAAAVVSANQSDNDSANPQPAAPGSPPASGSVRALRVDNASSAASLGVNVGDTIPLTCIDGLSVTPPDVCSCEHGHGTIGVPVLARTSPDFDAGACGHGCIVTTSNPSVTCP